MYEPFPVISSAPPQKRPENPAGATAAAVDRVHRGPRRDQPVDHGGMAPLSRFMQRRPASGAGDATGTAAADAGCRQETKRMVMGCFSGWLGKICG